jgi:hypothetical protein
LRLSSGDASDDGRASQKAVRRRSRFASGGVIRDLLLRLGPHDDMAGWIRGLLIAMAAALFLSLAGAFGSEALGFWPGFAYWTVLMVAGYVWGSLLSRWILRSPRAPKPRWAQIGLVAFVIAATYTPAVGLASHVAFGARFEESAIITLGLSVFAVSLVMTSLNVLIETHVAVTRAGAAPPKFLERLPLRLRGAEVWAVEAEDHYLRLHTSKGQDLILLRLADAVAELEGVEGAQVHRSWWVARDAIVDARRGDGRAVLTLKDGAQVPVSRTYAGLLRERGWI